jgi:hypothetical protein
MRCGKKLDTLNSKYRIFPFIHLQNSNYCAIITPEISCRLLKQRVVRISLNH